jgi:hypothetical protein
MTHVYLSLIESGVIGRENDTKENESLQIILQSLFSRADTGLLKGDHGPTLPGGVDAIKKLFGN